MAPGPFLLDFFPLSPSDEGIAYMHLSDNTDHCNIPESLRAYPEDSAWFAANPGRNYLLRPARQNEWGKVPPHVPYFYTIVRQVMPDAHARLVCATDRPFADKDHSEQSVCSLWHVGADAVKADPEILALFDLGERQGKTVQ
jgi:hypothetical protein